MKRISILVLFITSFYTSKAQVDGYLFKFDSLYRAQNYEAILDYPKEDEAKMHSKSLFFIAMAHYVSGGYMRAIDYFDKAIKKGPVDGDMYYYKGMTYFYMKMYSDAATWYRKALQTLYDYPDVHAQLAITYDQMENKEDSVLYYHVMAIKYPGAPVESYMRIPQIFKKRQENVMARKYYEKAAYFTAPVSKEKQECYYNMAYYDFLDQKFEVSRDTLISLLKMNPSHYEGMVNLVKTYNSLKQFDQADSLKNVIYKAKKDAELPQHLYFQFGIDEYYAKGRQIIVYEKFNFINDEQINNYTFYVIDHNKEVVASFSTEIDTTSKNYPYKIYMDKDGERMDFPKLSFEKNTLYREFRKTAVDLLEYCRTYE